MDDGLHVYVIYGNGSPTYFGHLQSISDIIIIIKYLYRKVLGYGYFVYLYEKLLFVDMDILFLNKISIRKGREYYHFSIHLFLEKYSGFPWIPVV